MRTIYYVTRYRPAWFHRLTWFCAGFGAASAYDGMMTMHGWPVVALVALAVIQFWIARHVEHLTSQ